MCFSLLEYGKQKGRQRHVVIFLEDISRRKDARLLPALPQPSAASAPTGCYPISDEGTCYEPGEYCRDDDHGMTGVAGDGETITCEDNDGWRWEPS